MGFWIGILACQSLRSVFCLSVWPWEVGTARAPPLAHSSPRSGSPPVRPLCWVFHTLSPPQSPGWAPRAGHGLRASTSSRTMHPWPAACYPQRSPWPISTSAVASCKHDHLPPSLPTPARPPGPTKRGLLRAVWSPLPSPRGLRVALGTGRIHTHSFNLVATQSVPVPGLCKLHQAQREGVRSRVGRGHVQCGSRAGVTCRGHVQRGSRAGVTCNVRHVQGSRAACVACRGHVQRVCVPCRLSVVCVHLCSLECASSRGQSVSVTGGLWPLACVSASVAPAAGPAHGAQHARPVATRMASRHLGAWDAGPHPRW